MTLTTKTASILLALILSARATSFLFSKICLESMSPFSLLSVRFIIASIILLLIFHKHIIDSFNKSDMHKGFILGTLFYFTLLCEHIGLKTTNSGTSSLLENTAIILVPLAEALLARAYPQKKILMRAILAFLGVALLSYNGESLSLSFGEILLLGAALFYSSAIIVTNRLAALGDTLNMGLFQVFTIALWSTVTATIFECYTVPSSSEQIIMLFILAAVCTCFGFTLQPMAQSKVDSSKTALYCAINPLIAIILGALFLQENLSPISICGSILILLSLVIQ